MRYFFGIRACAVCLAAVLMAISGCAEHKQEQASKPPVNESQSKPSVSESQILQKPPLESSDRTRESRSPGNGGAIARQRSDVMGSGIRR